MKRFLRGRKSGDENFFSTHKLILNKKLVVMRILVNGIAIGIASFLLPGIHVSSPGIMDILYLGLVFGLLNAFVKPLIQVLTISLLFVTYGLVVIIINTAMLFLLDLFAKEVIQIDSVLAGLVGGVIISLLSLIMDNIFGLTPPIHEIETIEQIAKEWPSQGVGFIPQTPPVEMDQVQPVGPIPAAPETAPEPEPMAGEMETAVSVSTKADFSEEIPAEEDAL